MVISERGTVGRAALILPASAHGTPIDVIALPDAAAASEPRIPTPYVLTLSYCRPKNLLQELGQVQF